MAVAPAAAVAGAYPAVVAVPVVALVVALWDGASVPLPASAWVVSPNKTHHRPAGRGSALDLAPVQNWAEGTQPKAPSSVALALSLTLTLALETAPAHPSSVSC